MSKTKKIPTANRKAGKALLCAAKRGDATALASALAAGADIDAKSQQGWTAAMEAAFKGHERCLRLLIAAGADIDAQDKGGWTAATWAAHHYPGLAALLNAISLSRREELTVSEACCHTNPSSHSTRSKNRI